ncbi:MAG: hypothetical protein WDN03_11140 [Rhizomicrobium sp.]
MSIEPAQPKPRDATLIEFMPAQASSAALARAALAEFGGNSLIFRALDEPRVTIYLRDLPEDFAPGHMAEIRARLAPLAAGDIEVSRLAALRAFVGASRDAPSRFHYVVRTDIEPGGEDELERWYDEEHMPALAAVPGVIRAERLVSLDAPPRYYAYYDLTSPAVRQTPEWLAVRETDWSGRVRPMFRHTRRIVSRRLVAADEESGS